jgi:hypothetical protein
LVLEVVGVMVVLVVEVGMIVDVLVCRCYYILVEVVPLVSLAKVLVVHHVVKHVSVHEALLGEVEPMGVVHHREGGDLSLHRAVKYLICLIHTIS